MPCFRFVYERDQVEIRLVKSLRKRCLRFFSSALLQNVRDKKLRPFDIDEEGLWFKTGYGFSVFSNLTNRILELDVNPFWEEKESVFIINNVKQGDVFVDVGANIGYFSMLAARQKAKKVLAIEPIPTTFDFLTKNIRHNNFGDIIKAFNVALGSEEGISKCVSSRGPKNHIEYEVDNIHAGLPVIEARVTTLDNLQKNEKQTERIDFIKVDIEGYEYEFLMGARVTISNFRPTILMEIVDSRLAKYNASSKQVFDFMTDLGYMYLFVNRDSVGKGSFPSQDIKKARNFIFYIPNRRPVY